MFFRRPGGRAVLLLILMVAAALIDLLVAAIVVHYYNVQFKYTYADALIASAGVFFCLYHWALVLAHYALLISYQLDQNSKNGKDFNSYIGAVLTTGLLLTIVEYIAAEPKPQRYDL
jgi:hypothetical protein